jgi:tRNA modification GTPase
LKYETDTIAAQATPPGRGGVGIIRVSGRGCAELAKRVLGSIPKPREATLMKFHDDSGTAIDEGIAIYFPSPYSFTGEDVLELQGHGGPVVMDMLLAAAQKMGARMARPGEFSERAFLNGKIDLAQAEAIADLIDSSSVDAARSALRSLQGEFSQRINTLAEQIIQLRMYVEAAIDFPDEEIDFLAEGAVLARLHEQQQTLCTILEAARQGSLLREGMTVVLAGLPNAGKSSLLNALAGQESAIVTDIPGTTRDLLREQISIDGMPLHIIDTAGLRDSTDLVEQEGIRRAWGAIEGADQVLLLIDDRTGITEAEHQIVKRLPTGVGITVVRNKIDLSGEPAGVEHGAYGEEIRLSAKLGSGIALLREHLKGVMGYQQGSEGAYMARRRHLAALHKAQQHLSQCEGALEHGQGELVAEELRLAHQALGEITGEFTSEDLLGRIFTSFCIGK